MARDWWQRGKAFDLWSIPHFLFGVLMGAIPQLVGVPLLTAFILMTVLAILWEIFEKLVNVKESIQNILLDISLPVFSFTLTSFIIFVYPIHTSDLTVVASAVLFLYIFTNISGWLAYRRRQRDFRG